MGPKFQAESKQKQILSINKIKPFEIIEIKFALIQLKRIHNYYHNKSITFSFRKKYELKKKLKVQP